MLKSRLILSHKLFTLAALLTFGIITAPAWAGEKQSIDAFAVWQGDGAAFRTGDQSATFVGAVAGRFFVETKNGPLEAGNIVCPATLDINLADAGQSGTGKCTITTNDGEQVYADWSCEGIHLIGCDGTFTLTGGTGRFKGVSGGGPIVVRSSFQNVAQRVLAGLDEAPRGIMIWRGLTYEMSEAK